MTSAAAGFDIGGLYIVVGLIARDGKTFDVAANEVPSLGRQLFLKERLDCYYYDLYLHKGEGHNITWRVMFDRYPQMMSRDLYMNALDTVGSPILKTKLNQTNVEMPGFVVGLVKVFQLSDSAMNSVQVFLAGVKCKEEDLFAGGQYIWATNLLYQIDEYLRQEGYASDSEQKIFIQLFNRGIWNFAEKHWESALRKEFPRPIINMARYRESKSTVEQDGPVDQ